MDVRHLQLLRDLADYGSVTAVAEATHRTASAVSQQLRTAQRLARVRLVEPDGRGIRLTEAGLLLAEGAVEVATALAAVQARWDAYRNDPGGGVSVVAFPSAATLLLPKLLGAVADAGIQLRIADVDPAESEFSRLTLDYDIVIAHSIRAPEIGSVPGLLVRELVLEPLDIAMSDSHPLASRSSLRAHDVAGASWIGVPEGYPFDTVLAAIEKRVGRRLHVAQRVKDNRLIEAIVASSDHLAVLPRFTTPAEGNLRLLPISDVPAYRYLFALMRSDRAQRRAVQTVFRMMSAIARLHSLECDSHTDS
ncbi:LysR family transcriptional regulator [Buchananella hordeovulneris]|uniref:LysR family transcriptional regulator n=1 Tax=Buchananella hordeovulneris TaxID=52770 RepID=UPI000F5EB6B8|nr:LysR family transcriptional regulator [Buchananella hordeovulneris]MDO5080629.1 LysR family transcriptional regulator [Buchananella hordeovulneris]RRD42574.1 LysR family transcriptional regulator [Buchananella hordeovulneris]